MPNKKRQKKLFIENGGVAENFIPTTDAVEEEFKKYHVRH